MIKLKYGHMKKLDEVNRISPLIIEKIKKWNYLNP